MNASLPEPTIEGMLAWAEGIDPLKWDWNGGVLNIASSCPVAEYIRSLGWPDAQVGPWYFLPGIKMPSRSLPRPIAQVVSAVDRWSVQHAVNGRCAPMTKADLIGVIKEVMG